MAGEGRTDDGEGARDEEAGFPDSSGAPGSGAGVVQARNLSGGVHFHRAEPPQPVSGSGSALECYHRSAVLHRRLGDRSREALAWQGAGDVYVRLERHGQAAAFYRRAAAVYRELGDAWREAVALDGLATAVEGEDPGRAREHRAEARRLPAAFDDPRAVAKRERIGEADALGD